MPFLFSIALVEQRLADVLTLRNSVIGVAFQRSQDSKVNRKVLKVFILNISCRSDVFDENTVHLFQGDSNPVDFHEIGVVTQVVGSNWPRPSYTIQLTGICRVKIGNIVSKTPYIIAGVTQLDKFPGNLLNFLNYFAFFELVFPIFCRKRNRLERIWRFSARFYG
jgi:hypothetical protein